MVCRLSWKTKLPLLLIWLGRCESFQSPVSIRRSVEKEVVGQPPLAQRPLSTPQARRIPVPLASESSASTSSTGNVETDKQQPVGGLDTPAIVKYLVSIGVQLSLVTAVFQGLDQWVIPNLPFAIPFAVNALGMYFMALKSRVFNPLSNRRPKPSTTEIDGVTQKRNMPTWTPPGFVFPIVWLLLIGPLRAITSAMIIQTTGSYTSPALLSLMLHLSIGDVWNTINNVEQRYGTSVLGILFVWSSAAFCSYQYYQVLPLAGKLLSLKLIWLTIASSLIIRTWQLNPKGDKLAPILPTKGDGNPTKFEWFAKAE